MAVLEVVESSHEHVVDLRHELGRVRDALDRTDAVLGVTDDALERAEHAIETSRRISPYVLSAVGVVAIGAAAYLIWRSRRRAEES